MIQVAAGIIERDGLVLLCRRKKGARYELKWEFPGGKVKDGEDPKATLKRELVEELDVSAEVGEQIFRQVWRYSNGGEFDIHFYSVRRFAGAPKNLAFEEIRWVSPETLDELDLLEGSKELARRLGQRNKRL